VTAAGRPLTDDETRELGAVHGRDDAAVAYAFPSAVPPTTAGLWRITATGSSVVCKVLRAGDRSTSAWAGSTDPAHPYYWRREALVYESRLLDRFAGRLRAPRCLGVFERADGSVALWLEDLNNTTPGRSWPLTRYGEAAYDVGVAQASSSAVADDGPVWLSRGWLHAYVARRASYAAVLDADDAWRRHPLVRALVLPQTVDAVRSLWAARDWFLTRVDALPRTVCHLDLHPANLFADAGGTVAIDWAYAGAGCVGEDLGTLVLDAVFDFHLPPAALGELTRLVIEGYADGLGAAGVKVSRAVIELGMTAAAAAKYAWILPAMLRAAAEGHEQLNHRPIAEAFPVWARIVPSVVAIGRRAFEVAHQLGIPLPA
jgi:hypothetical protein